MQIIMMFLLFMLLSWFFYMGYCQPDGQKQEE